MTLISSASLRRTERRSHHFPMPPDNVVAPPHPDAVADGTHRHTPGHQVPNPDRGPLAPGTGGMLGLLAAEPVNRGRGGKR